MDTLIPIIQQEGKPAVSARELYAALGAAPGDFNRWLKANILNNPFALDGEDYVSLHDADNSDTQGVKAGRPTTDWALALSFAKKLAMMTRTAEGEKVRSYFLAMEAAAIKAATKPGKKRLPHQDARWLELREEGVGQRKTFVTVLASHGVSKPADFSHCTNSLYVGLFNRTAKEIRVAAKLKKSARTRDAMSSKAIMAAGLAEEAAKERIVKDNIRGAYRCAATAQEIASNIARAVGGRFSPVAKQLTA